MNLRARWAPEGNAEHSLALMMGEDDFGTNTYMCTRDASASKTGMNFSESSQIVLHKLVIPGILKVTAGMLASVWSLALRALQ